ncbi:MAG: hypothetical protein P4L84_35735, partial [Isosphaeraceae bacterium]|nr:hypothetical protein [Isosphaeraceae bacterium]
PAIAASLLEAAMSARAAPAPWLVRSTVGQAQWFVMRAVPAGTVPAGVVAAAESILKGMIMTKLKLTGVVAALALSAAIGVAAVRAQDRPVPARGVSPSADVAGPQGVAAGQPDRMRALEDKLDRLLRVLESPGAKPGSGRVPLQMGTDPVIGVPRLDLPPAPANGMSPRGLQGAPPKPVANPLMELERDMSPTTRLNDHERRLAAVERKLEQLMSRLPPAPPPGDAVETAPRTSGNIPLRTDSEPALSLVPGPAPGDDIAPEPSSEPGRN